MRDYRAENKNFAGDAAGEWGPHKRMSRRSVRRRERSLCRTLESSNVPEEEMGDRIDDAPMVQR